MQEGAILFLFLIGFWLGWKYHTSARKRKEEDQKQSRKHRAF